MDFKKITYFFICGFTFCICFLACKQPKNIEIPTGFQKLNDTCFYKFLNPSNIALNNKNNFVLERRICNAFEIEIPFTSNYQQFDTIDFAQEKSNIVADSILKKLGNTDTLIVCMPAKSFFANEGITPSVMIAPSQNVYIYYVAKDLSINSLTSTLPLQEKSTDKIVEKIANTKTETTIATTPKVAPARSYNNDFEKEEFTLRYYLEYTKPYLLKNEIEPGFYMKITNPGTGDFAKTGDMVTIDYVGRFALNGKKFDDSSLNPDPFEFELGKPDQILKGIEKTIYKLKKGGRAEVYFTSKYGYGANGSSTGIVGKYNSLTFAVHLKKINKKQDELNQ